MFRDIKDESEKVPKREMLRRPRDRVEIAMWVARLTGIEMHWQEGEGHSKQAGRGRREGQRRMAVQVLEKVAEAPSRSGSRMLEGNGGRGKRTRKLGGAAAGAEMQGRVEGGACQGKVVEAVRHYEELPERQQERRDDGGRDDVVEIAGRLVRVARNSAVGDSHLIARGTKGHLNLMDRS